jgi:phosphoglycerate kinase
VPDFRTLDDVDLRGKRVLLRVDLNVPMTDGEVSDQTRIQRMAPTVAEIAGKGGKVILLSHFGRPKERSEKDSLRPVAAALARHLKRNIAFADDCIGPAAVAAVAAMKNGDIVCLENTRFHPGEEKNDPAFVAALAALGDIWVNDAFSVAHRAHASTEGLGYMLPAYAGRTMEAELVALAMALETPQRPVAAIVGGAKVSTKLDLLRTLVAKVDVLVIGGGMANTFLGAQGKAVGMSLLERDLADSARHILATAQAHHCQVVLPVDAIVAKAFKARGPTRAVEIDAVGSDDLILDIGPRTVEQVISVLGRVKTLVWNGLLGAFELEPFDIGTIEVAEAAAELTAAGKLVSVAGGGDTVAALNAAGFTERFTYVSTAGGAVLEWMEGKVLPGVEVLKVRGSARTGAQSPNPEVPNQSPAPVRIEERDGKIAQVNNRNSSIYADERDFDAWREVIIDHLQELTSGDFRAGTNHSRARDRIVALGMLLPGELADVKERQFRIGYEIERFDGLVTAYKSGGDDMPELHAAVLEDLTRLRAALKIGLVKLDRWSDFLRSATTIP